MPVRALPVFTLLAFLPACVERARDPAPSDDDLRTIAKNLLVRPPPLPRRIDAELGGRLLYLGLELDKARAKAGEILKLTHYWKCLRPAGPGSELGLFLVGPAGRTVSLPHRPLGGRYPLARWQPGQIIRDAHTLSVPADWPDASLAIEVGLRSGEAWSKVSRGPGAGGTRVRAATVELERPRPTTVTPKVMQLVASRAASPPVLDGRLDDPAWTRTSPSDPFRAAGTAAPQSVLRCAWDPKHLYVGVELEDASLTSSTGCEGGDRVVVMFDGGGLRHELTVSASGTVCGRRGQRPWQPSTVKGRVALHGTLDHAGDRDQGWSVELAIPWAALRGRGRAPRGGTSLRFNVYRVEVGASAPPLTLAWSLGGGTPDADGDLQLGDERGNSIAR
jgi:hypothetical protein